MKPGKYIRTKEIREKQSLKMKGRKSPLKGTKNPKSTGRKRTVIRILVPCEFCGKDFEKLKTNPKKFCSQSCYMETKKGKPWFFGTYDKSYMQTEEYKNTLRKPETPAFIRYKNAVHRLTRKVYNNNKINLNPNNYPLTLAGVDGGYQIDHIIPVREGFNTSIPPEVLSRKENLRIIPWKQNLQRNKS